MRGKVNTLEYKVVIVGAGPGGISLAAELIAGGMDKEDIIVLEKSDKDSWVIRKLYAEQKLVTANYKGLSVECNGVMDFYDMSKPDALKALKDTIDKYDINVLFETEVAKIEKVDGKFIHTTSRGVIYSEYSAIAIGIFGRPNKPGYRIPSSVKKMIAFDITSSVVKEQKVLVVGAGDSAAEYVQYLVNDNDVYMASRSSADHRMNERNSSIIKEYIEHKRITFLEPCNIVALEEVRENGVLLPKVAVKFAEKEIDDQLFDRVIYAIGGTTPINFLKVTGMRFLADGKTPEMSDSHESSIENLFLAGDLGNGLRGGSIILAFNTSHLIAGVILERSNQ